jgi:hypothetical protein
MRTAQPAAVDNHLCCGQPASEKAWGLDAPSTYRRTRHTEHQGATRAGKGRDTRGKRTRASPRTSSAEWSPLSPEVGRHRYHRADVFVHMRGGHRSLQGVGCTIFAIATSSNTPHCNSSTLPRRILRQVSRSTCDDAVSARVSDLGATRRAPRRSTAATRIAAAGTHSLILSDTPARCWACADGEVIYVPRGYSKTQWCADFRWNRTHERWRQW